MRARTDRRRSARAAASDLLLGRAGVAVGDVVADRAAEQPGVLQHHADRAAQLGARHLRDVDAVERDRAGVDLVEAHEQVDERRLARAGRPDDGDRLAGLRDEREVFDQRLVRLVAERDVLERDLAAHGGRAPGGRGVGRCSSASSNSNTRSAEATPDCSMLAIDASWVSGWRELPRVLDERLHVAELIAPDATRRPPTTAMATKLRFPTNIIAGMIAPEMNCARKLAS